MAKKSRSPARAKTSSRGKAPSKAKPKAKPRAKPKAKSKARSAPARKPAASRVAARPQTPALPKDLEARLMALALEMEKPMDALTLQALSEFADAWEEHFRTVKSLQEDDRIQLNVAPE